MKLFCLLLPLMYVLAGMQPGRAQESRVQSIRKAVLEMIQTFNGDQRDRALMPLADTSRIHWNNLPAGLVRRKGISVGELSDAQRRAVHRIIYACLSSQGYLKATGIMHLDNLLNVYYDTLYSRKQISDSTYQEIKSLKFGQQNFFFSVYGSLSSDSVWALKLEGHHLSLNFTFSGDSFTTTPMFVGTDPAEFPTTEFAGWRVLGKEEDLGIQLINSLSPGLQKAATASKAVPQDIITSATSNKRLVETWGVKVSEFDPAQTELVERIVAEFTENLEHDKARLVQEQITSAGLRNAYFGWIGSYKESEPHYYILNGPTFLIEFDNRGNHIHAIWREKGNDFGEDLLKEHYLRSAHHQKKQ